MKKSLVMLCCVLSVQMLAGCNITNRIAVSGSSTSKDGIQKTEIIVRDVTEIAKEVRNAEAAMTEELDDTKGPDPSETQAIWIDGKKLSLGEARENIVNEFGQPTEELEIEVWESDGLEHQTWMYGGVELRFVREQEMILDSMIVHTEAQNAITGAGVAIGSEVGKVNELYHTLMNPEQSTEDNIYIGESLYENCLVFKIKDEKVDQIYLGVVAE